MESTTPAGSVGGERRADDLKAPLVASHSSATTIILTVSYVIDKGRVEDLGVGVLAADAAPVLLSRVSDEHTVFDDKVAVTTVNSTAPPAEVVRERASGHGRGILVSEQPATGVIRPACSICVAACDDQTIENST